MSIVFLLAALLMGCGIPPRAPADMATCDAADYSNDTLNCNRCGNACPAPAEHGSAACAGGGCYVRCSAPWIGCTLGAASCETDSSNSAANCGGCGRICGAGNSCVGGVCQ